MKLNFPTDKSGAVGDIVYTRNRQGTAVRARVTPLNPQTLAQQNQRGILAAVASEWRGLTAAARSAWKALAAQLDGNLSGFGAYVKINATRVTCGEAKLEVAPLIPAFGIFTLTSMAATVDAGALTLALTGLANTVAPDKYLVEGSIPVSQGIDNVNSDFRVIGAFAPGAIVAGVGPAYVAKFGVPAVTQAISLRISAVKDGFKAIPYAYRAIVTAGA